MDTSVSPIAFLESVHPDGVFRPGPAEGGQFMLVGIAITPTGQLGDLAGGALSSDS
jgi:hypothetical protein